MRKDNIESSGEKWALKWRVVCAYPNASSEVACVELTQRRTPQGSVTQKSLLFPRSKSFEHCNASKRVPQHLIFFSLFSPTRFDVAGIYLLPAHLIPAPLSNFKHLHFHWFSLFSPFLLLLPSTPFIST